MAKEASITIPLDIPERRVVRVEQSRGGEFLLIVESLRTTTACRRCGAVLTEVHGLETVRRLRHLSIFGRPVHLLIRPKRFRCPHCSGNPTTIQHLDWYDPEALHTKAYERHFIRTLINSTISYVVAKEDVSYDALLGILNRWVATVDWKQVAPFAVLGIDEIVLTKGHRNVVAGITAQTDHGLHVLAILPDRLKATVLAWLRAVPAAWRAGITTVCTDIWEVYITAVQEALPNATVVIDRFHVTRHYRQAVDDLRKTEVRRLHQELPEAEQGDLKHTLWLVRKDPADLMTDEQAHLAALFRHSLPLRQAHTLREELTRIFETVRSKADGLRRIGFWRVRVVKSGLTCFDRFLALLDNWLDLIANYVLDHQTSGFVEGLNNKLKVLKRRYYGLRNYQCLFQRLTLDVSGYRWFRPWRSTGHNYMWAPSRQLPKTHLASLHLMLKLLTTN